jgi:hypothetical protein
LVFGLDPFISDLLTVFDGVGVARGTFYLGNHRGSAHTKKEWEKKLDESKEKFERQIEQERQHQQQLSTQFDKEQVKIHFRSKIQWMEERKSDFNEKIASRRTSEKAQEIYRDLITELDRQKRDLERTRDSIGL